MLNENSWIWGRYCKWINSIFPWWIFDIGSLGTWRVSMSQITLLNLYLFSDLDPFVNQQGGDLTVREGESIIISLPSIRSVPEPTITWLEDYHTTVQPEMNRRHITRTKDLIILESHLSDNNRLYLAKASNLYVGSSDTQSRVFTLTVESKFTYFTDTTPLCGRRFWIWSWHHHKCCSAETFLLDFHEILNLILSSLSKIPVLKLKNRKKC